MLATQRDTRWGLVGGHLEYEVKQVPKVAFLFFTFLWGEGGFCQWKAGHFIFSQICFIT